MLCSKRTWFWKWCRVRRKPTIFLTGFVTLIGVSLLYASLPNNQFQLSEYNDYDLIYQDRPTIHRYKDYAVHRKPQAHIDSIYDNDHKTKDVNEKIGNGKSDEEKLPKSKEELLYYYGKDKMQEKDDTKADVNDNNDADDDENDEGYDEEDEYEQENPVFKPNDFSPIDSNYGVQKHIQHAKSAKNVKPISNAVLLSHITDKPSRKPSQKNSQFEVLKQVEYTSKHRNVNEINSRNETPDGDPINQSFNKNNQQENRESKLLNADSNAYRKGDINFNSMHQNNLNKFSINTARGKLLKIQPNQRQENTAFQHNVHQNHLNQRENVVQYNQNMPNQISKQTDMTVTPHNKVKTNIASPLYTYANVTVTSATGMPLVEDKIYWSQQVEDLVPKGKVYWEINLQNK